MEDITEATIYSWQFLPPFDHPMDGIRYIGQTIQTLLTRTKQHKYHASKGKTGDFGLHYLWNEFPHEEYWEIRVYGFRAFQGDMENRRIQASKWLDKEEKRLISLYGGPMRSFDETEPQTLNLTTGGQGDPDMRWAKILKRSRKNLDTVVWPAFQRYYKDNEDLNVPRDFVEVGTGIKLGKVVGNIRVKGCYLQHEDFKVWLEEHNFVFKERYRNYLETVVWPAFQKYYKDNEDLNVPRDFVEVGTGIKLGAVVSDIREKGCYLHNEDFKVWLEEHNFVFKDARRNHLVTVVWPAFQRYYKDKEHLNVPRDFVEVGTEIKLGDIVNRIRTTEAHLHNEDFKVWLEEHNFVFKDVHRNHLDTVVWPAFQRYYKDKEHLNVPRDFIEHGTGIKLGSIVGGIRGSQCYLHNEDFKEWLEEHNFVFKDVLRNDLDTVVWPALQRYYEDNEDLNVPYRFVDVETGINLGAVVYCIRSRESYLYYEDFKMWLWLWGFKMSAEYFKKDKGKNKEKWDKLIEF